jgi:NIPSNAP
MERRHMLAGLAASALMGLEGRAAAASNTYLELKTWKLHNSPEHQPERVAEYLEHGLAPALARGGAKLAGAFANLLGPDGPYYVTLAQYASLEAMQAALTKLASEEAHRQALEKLSSSGPGLPFVRVESSLLRSFDAMPEPALAQDSEMRPPRIFELRTYESQTFLTLARKVAMFNNGEADIFKRLGMRPVFFGEAIAGPRQPNLSYMLSFDSLAERDRLWGAFGSDPEWKKLSSQPELKDSEIVANISNVILRPLPFSAIR